jgi:hypothetical protein
VGAFLFQVIEKASVITNQERARHCQLRQSLKSAFRYRSGAISNPFPALKILADEFVMLEPLKFVKGGQVWISVTQVNNQSYRDLVVFEVV